MFFLKLAPCLILLNKIITLIYMITPAIINSLQSVDTTEVSKIISYTLNTRICHHKVKFLYKLLQSLHGSISSYLEIGVHSGCSMSYVLSSSFPPQIAVGVDLFEDTLYHDILNKNTIDTNLRKLNTSTSLTLIKGDSKEQQTKQNILDISSSFDLIFIDGDHSYNGVKYDFFILYDLLSKNGVMVFDDFNRAQTNIGVFKFINELISDYNKYFTGYFEYSDNEHSGEFKNGIICFYK